MTDDVAAQTESFAMSSAELSAALTNDVTDALSALSETTLPGLRLPDSFAGHAVNSDPACHLLKTLTLLLEIGVDQVAGLDLRERSHELLSSISPSVEAFSAFGVGESVERLGGLEAVSDPERCLEALRTPGVIADLTGGSSTLPLNYAIVATRCLAAEARLTGSRPADLDGFLERSAALLGQQTNGWIDDMWDPLVHYDIYTPDMYLFAEPFADEIEAVWTDGFASVLGDLDVLVTPNGPVGWGRSIGLLSLAMTVELAAVGVHHGLLAEPTAWIPRADTARRRLVGLMPNGLCAAHQYRSTMSYRGPQRRLQMTFDLLDKLAGAAIALDRSTATGCEPGEAWAPSQSLIEVGPSSEASNKGRPAIWSYRSRHVSAQIPLMRGFSTDYLPSLRWPGIVEPPTEGPPACLPAVHVDGTALVPAGVPCMVTHDKGRLTTEHTGWAAPGAGPGDLGSLGGSRRSTTWIDGRSVVTREELHIDLPDATTATVLVPEIAHTPLRIGTSDGVNVRRIDTSGLAEWRSYFHEISSVHQIEIPVLGGRATAEWRVSPRLRVADTHFGAAYAAELHRAWEATGRATVAHAPTPGHEIGPDFVDALRSFDVLHLGWPEWWIGIDPDRTRRAVEAVRQSGVKVVWTRHNARPHHAVSVSERAAADRCYQMWAGVTDAACHHSKWGQSVDRSALPYRATTTHHLVRHGHWGRSAAGRRSRSAVEAELGWSQEAIRLGILGADRPHKDTLAAVHAVLASRRRDLELVVRWDGPGLPDDDRLIVLSGHATPRDYWDRCGALDALILPFDREGGLTTGTAFDAIAVGCAAVVSEWAFLGETFGEAGIPMGSGGAALTDLVEELDRERLAEASAATTKLRSRHDFDVAAGRLAEIFDDLTSA